MKTPCGGCGGEGGKLVPTANEVGRTEMIPKMCDDCDGKGLIEFAKEGKK